MHCGMTVVLGPIALAAVLCTQACGDTCYVDQDHPQASDAHAGTEESPWKTLNHAAEVLRAADTVLVNKGTYDVGASLSWATPAVGSIHRRR